MPSTIFGGSNPSIISRIATNGVSGHRVVVPADDDEVVYADYTSSAHAVRPHWLTMGAAVAGASVRLLLFGKFEEPSWAWTPGAALYFGANGVLSQSMPGSGYVLIVAVALSPTIIYFDPGISITI